MFGDYSQCERCRQLVEFGADSTPKLRPYPTPSLPVKLLFIGWNPPKPLGGFWENDDDHLLQNLKWIMNRLEWSMESEPRAFRNWFRTSGFYFIHAVKCYSNTEFPEGTPGTKIMHACVDEHLHQDLMHLGPKAICVLGQIPFRALKRCCRNKAELPTQPRYLEGAKGHVFLGPDRVPVLITCFPDGQQDPGVQRQRAFEHLGSWKELRALP